MKVACVQLEPVHGNKKASMAKAESLLRDRFSNISSNFVDGERLPDIIILPEMAFTGYLFRDQSHIEDLAEDISEGDSETQAWCSKIAQQYKSGVCVGFPRKEKENGVTKAYNSLMLVDPDGTLLVVYDKHHLYSADETWACEGESFKHVALDWIKKKDGTAVCAGLGICMDINPKGFVNPWHEFEFAQYLKDVGVDLILFCSAWCKDPDDIDQTPNGMETMNYWCSRLQPLLQSNVYFCVADRVGTELNDLSIKGKSGSTHFCGTSCVLHMQSPSIIACLDEYKETVLFVHIDL